MIQLKIINVPGTEEYTKPLEISALKKFLSKVKKVQEEHTTLNKDNLLIPEKDINIKNVNNLEDFLDLIKVNDPRELDLSKKKIELEGNKENTLSNYIDLLATSLTNINLGLENQRIGLDASLDKLELENQRIGLDASLLDNKLEDEKITLETSKYIELSDEKIELKASLNNSLVTERVILEDSEEIPKLEKELILLETIPSNKGVLDVELSLIKLEDKRLELNNNNNELTLLSDKLESLKNTSDIKLLVNKLLLLSKEGDLQNLPDSTVLLDKNDDTNLSDKLEELPVTQVDSLDNKIIELNKPEDQDLSSHKESLKTEELIEKLSDKIINITNNKEQKLDKAQILLKEVTEISSLSKLIISLEKNKDLKLNKTKVSLNVIEKIKSICDNIVLLNATESNSLVNTLILLLTETLIESLEDYLKKVQESMINLEQVLVDLNDSLITIPENENSKDIEELPKGLSTLVVDKENKLDDTLIRNPNDNPGISQEFKGSLYTEADRISNSDEEKKLLLEYGGNLYTEADRISNSDEEKKLLLDYGGSLYTEADRISNSDDEKKLQLDYGGSLYTEADRISNSDDEKKLQLDYGGNLYTESDRISNSDDEKKLLLEYGGRLYTEADRISNSDDEKKLLLEYGGSLYTEADRISNSDDEKKLLLEYGGSLYTEADRISNSDDEKKLLLEYGGSLYTEADRISNSDDEKKLLLEYGGSLYTEADRISNSEHVDKNPSSHNWAGLNQLYEDDPNKLYRDHKKIVNPASLNQIRAELKDYGGYSAGMKYLMNLDSPSPILLSDDELKELDAIKSYIGAGDDDSAAKYLVTIDILDKMGSWGKKFAAYLSSMLSKTSKFKSYIPYSDIDLFVKEISNGLTIEYNEAEDSLKSLKAHFLNFKEKQNLYTDTINRPDIAAEDDVTITDPSEKSNYVERDKLNNISDLNNYFGKSGKSSDFIEGKSTNLRIPEHKMPNNFNMAKALLNPIDVMNSAMRWLVEESIGLVHTKGVTGVLREKLIAETLNGLILSKGLLLYGDTGLDQWTISYLNPVNRINELVHRSNYTANSYNFVRGSVMTLDSNHNWEIHFYPYLGIENGGVSYLPAFREINERNMRLHGYRTTWTSFIPFTSYELNTKKLVSKTVGLFDGEIAYPAGIEFTNELRLSIADDLFKSWKIYFEDVMKCMSFASRPHSLMGTKTNNWDWESVYKEDEDFYTTIKDYRSAIAEGTIMPAPYKNVTFRCRIFCLTPQLDSIKEFDLLVVLKDLLEEFLGEIDSGPTELNLSFSIVGENPKGFSGDKLYLSVIEKDEVINDGSQFGSPIDYYYVNSNLLNNSLDILTGNGIDLLTVLT